MHGNKKEHQSHRSAATAKIEARFSISKDATTGHQNPNKMTHTHTAAQAKHALLYNRVMDSFGLVGIAWPVNWPGGYVLLL